jgi:hypothetical protein
VAAALAFTLVFFERLAFTDLILARGDTFAYFYPYWTARDAALRAGTLPMWSPDLFMGVPLLANSQLGTFYPPNWLTLALSAPDAVRVSLLLHVGFAWLGVYALARRALSVERLPAVVAASLFAFGGYFSGRAEQINQVQGLAWMPWLFVTLDAGLRSRSLLPWLALAVGVALQCFTGHTQTVFISAVGMGVYALCAGQGARGRLRGVLLLALAGGLALLLALPQLAPTLALSSISNRGGGLTPNQATAFSFSPFVMGRGLLPNYDATAPIFAEYIAYLGVIGVGLAVTGALAVRRVPRAWAWLALALIGLALAFGLYNPLYWSLASLPGFNLFRVPARWLALFALGAALLAAVGLHVWSHMAGRRRSVALATAALVVGLALAAWLLTSRNPDGTPTTAPTPITMVGWGVGLMAALALLWRARASRLPAALLLLELLIAGRAQPYNHPTTPEVYAAPRFSAAQLRALQAEQLPPGRLLSISQAYFDPGDKAALEARFAAQGLSETAIPTALLNVKLQEILAPNLPLAWGIPTVDGFDGGVLPTAYYTAFSALLLAPDALRTVDGRLREGLALESCGGACLPDQRWLNLTDTRYLLLDKVFDLWRGGVAYDTGIEVTPGAGETVAFENVQWFEADTVDVLYRCVENAVCAPPLLADAAEIAREPLERYQWIRYALPEAVVLPAVTLTTDGGTRVRALTLVDRRTASDEAAPDFQQLAPQPWTRILSSDIKLYENAAVLPRAFVVYDALAVPDSALGTETALDRMRDPAFDPRQTLILHTDAPLDALQAGAGSAAFRSYAPTEVLIDVQTDQPGWLFVSEAYAPGWTAHVNGQDAPLLRAHIMFRAVPVPAGESRVALRYAETIPVIPSVLAWLGVLLAAAIAVRYVNTP